METNARTYHLPETAAATLDEAVAEVQAATGGQVSEHEAQAALIAAGAAQTDTVAEELRVELARKLKRSAFTWRLAPEEAIRLDELILRLRSELGIARLDRATMLAALTALAAESPAVFGALAARLQA